MFEGIKKVFGDFIEAFRREIGDVKIFDDKSDFQITVKDGEIENVRISECEFKVEVEIREETAKSESVSFFVVDMKPEDMPVKINSLERNDDIMISDFMGDKVFSDIDVKSFEFEKIECFTKEVFIGELFKNNLRLTDLFDEFSWNANIFESNEKSINTLILDHELFPVSIIKSCDSVWGRIPVRRKMASWSEYTRENVREALEFIAERTLEKPRFKFVGIYRDIPLDRVKKMVFEKGVMEFTLKENGRRRGIVLDVLVVIDEKAGKYHVGPIVRKY